jgi:hypothetical protein
MIVKKLDATFIRYDRPSHLFVCDKCLQSAENLEDFNHEPDCESNFRPGFPRLIYVPGGGALRYFDIKLTTGEITQAWVDPSRQYAFEGYQWRRRDSDEYIPSQHIIGFRCVDGIEAQ